LSDLFVTDRSAFYTWEDRGKVGSRNHKIYSVSTCDFHVIVGVNRSHDNYLLVLSIPYHTPNPYLINLSMCDSVLQILASLQSLKIWIPYRVPHVTMAIPRDGLHPRS